MMTRTPFAILLAGVCVTAGFGTALALADDDSGPSVENITVPVAKPFKLAIRDRSWTGDPHAAPAGQAVLEQADGRVIWELSDVTSATTSADGRAVALLTSDYEVYTSKLPDRPQRVDNGPYLNPALSRDGTMLVAQRIGEAGHILARTFNTKGIALINLEDGRDRLVLEGNDLYGPSFATDQRVFFGSGGEEGVASLYILDLASNKFARVTNRSREGHQTFPSEAPRLGGG